MKEDPPPGAKCKDKFLVQSTFITPEKESLNLQDIVSLNSNYVLLLPTHTATVGNSRW